MHLLVAPDCLTRVIPELEIHTSSFPVAGGALGGDFTGTVTVLSTSTTSYNNHGDFVSQSPDKDDAAHSCIGKPIV
jgi:hypothetical protein